MTGKLVLRISLLTLSVTAGVLGVVPDFGPCPNVKTVENFDFQRFLGKWYEAERYFSILSVGTKCSISNYTMSEEGTIRVIESHVSTISKVESSAIGRVEPIGKSHEAKYYVKFDAVGIPYAMPYWVLGTDYDNYAVVHSCANIGLLSFKSVWILTRLRQPRIAVLENAYQILDKNQISRAYLFRTDQKNCPENH
ncbi:apolipoprotein D-like [Venturia canescens]|uniref:apolipoprotein D-like n=1 Tax=Venturia canescens TaxID=32260 RepID=UPI001C9D16F7|nr:apolipoprotein D-like [Venturia canescens]